ncbi:hypothetical protein QJL30_09955 [Clostridioides difficile]|nr:hypothetical protein [Clostridioides difficile]MDI3004262.1 hypothetical protein [Clostridioides difficile]
MNIQNVDKDAFDRIVKNNIIGLYLYKDDKSYICIDNSLGKLWMAKKKTEKEALDWLNDEDNSKYQILGEEPITIRDPRLPKLTAKQSKIILSIFEEYFKQ